VREARICTLHGGVSEVKIISPSFTQAVSCYISLVSNRQQAGFASTYSATLSLNIQILMYK